MFNRLFRVLAGSMLLGMPSLAIASPVTYDFSGILNNPINGSNQFTGSFTINVNPTVSTPGQITENGNDVSMSVTIGGQVINYANTAQYPNLATLTVGLNPSTYPVDPSGDNVSIHGVPPYSDPGYNTGFTLGFSSPTDEIFSRLGPDDVANLLNFNFSASDLKSASYHDSSGVFDGGIVTSIEIISAPEPSTLAVFAMLGVAAILHRRRRKSSLDSIAQ